MEERKMKCILSQERKSAKHPNRKEKPRGFLPFVTQYRT